MKLIKELPSRKWGLAAVAAVLILVIGVYVNYRLTLTPVSEDEQTQAFVIASGEPSPQVATRLKNQGLIRDRNSFITFLNLNGIRTGIKAGSYSLSPSQSSPEIARTITEGRATLSRMIVPEGYRIAQIQELARQQGIPEDEFESALNLNYPHNFLSSRPQGVSLEGYLFPDSYEVIPGTTAQQLIDTMLDNFGRRVGPEYVKAFAAQGLSLHEGLTIASIVEREVSDPNDRPKVAQVFLKRYKMDMPLGSDVTTEYASDMANKPFDLNINSPYNTRKFKGLPPGPISNPGLSSLDAVARPAATDFLYFVSASDGTTYFSKTLEQHNIYVAKYLK